MDEEKKIVRLIYDPETGEAERMGILMAIDAKISFMNQMEKRLAPTVTVETMAQIMPIIADTGNCKLDGTRKA